MTVWTVWERVNTWPEDGGGDYLERIFQNKDDAEMYCEKLNEEARKDGREESYFSVEEWPLH